MFVIDADTDVLLTPRTSVVLLGGEPPQSEALLGLIRRAAYVAAADFGAAMALRAGRVPELLVGDFDSLPQDMLCRCREGGAQVLSLPAHKDATDGELLLQNLRGQGWRRLVALGALGGRFDHALANILTALPLAQAGLEVCFCCDDSLLALLAAGEEPAELVLQNFGGCTVSLLALGQSCHRVELAGFEYPLAGGLAAGSSLGVSNVARQRRASVRLWGGSLLVCVNKNF